MAAPRRHTLTIYRVVRAIHPPFDGSGAARFGARWISAGQPAIYAAGCYAGALLEVLAHARRLDLKREYRCLTINVPPSVGIQNVDAGAVQGWDAPDYVASREVGDRWLRAAKTAVLCVPAVTGRPHEHNYIINPQHQHAHKLKLEAPHAVIWGERLAKVG